MHVASNTDYLSYADRKTDTEGANCASYQGSLHQSINSVRGVGKHGGAHPMKETVCFSDIYKKTRAHSNIDKEGLGR